MEKNYEMKRINIRIPMWLDEYYAERSAYTGVPKSSLMFLDLEQMYNQRTMADTLSKLSKEVEEMKVSSDEK